MTDQPSSALPSDTPQVEKDRALIKSARAKGTGPLAWAFVRLSGPGWLQSAITLGGGSLAGSLYLGVLGGYGMMWLQPLAMMLGVVMLSAIGYVALSTGERPFNAINKHVSPVLGWGWAIATLMANLVWCMPQFSLGTAAITQNLSPDGIGALPEFQGKLVCSILLFSIAAIVIWFYDSGGWGIKLFELILKGMVGIVVICFFGVVIKMSLAGVLNWGEILAGFVPDLSLLNKPAAAFEDVLSRTGEMRDYWSSMIVKDQQSVMIAAFATAVGINMTFLLPYSMLAKGWDKDFRGLAVFDLSTGLFIPFMIAISCVVIAAASQFHAKSEPGLVDLYALVSLDENTEVKRVTPPANLVKGYEELLNNRIKEKVGAEKFAALNAEELLQNRADLPVADREIAAMLVKRDSFNLANSLKEIAGEGVAQKVFGVGVLGMAVSTIIILMLINGFTVCEMLGVPAEGNNRRIAAFIPAITGALGPFFWNKAAVWLAVPTSMFGMALLPIAYWTFFFMMNNKKLMGANMPQGIARIRWNVLMLIASCVATFGSFWSIYSSPVSTIGFSCLGGFVLLAVAVHFLRKPEPA